MDRAGRFDSRRTPNAVQSLAMTHPTPDSSLPLHVTTRPALFAMLAVLLLGSALRIHGLNDQGLWGDEGWSMWLARGDSPRAIMSMIITDQHGPVYTYLLRGWSLLAGPSVLGLRWLTVLFSIASIALLYRLGARLFMPVAGAGAALAFALMDKHVVLTQEVRGYPILYFVMMAITLFYLRWRQAPRGGAALGFVAASVLGVHLHYYSLMVNLAIAAHALVTLRGRDRWRHFALLNAAIGLAFVPWALVAMYQSMNTSLEEAILTGRAMPFNRATLTYLATESLGSPVALYGLLALAGWLGPLVRTPGAMGRLPRDRRLSGALLAALWLGLPIILTVALHSRFPLLTDRNISVIMPAIALLVGFGLTAFDRFGRGFLVALIVVNGLLVTSAYYVKPPWRQMAADIAFQRPAEEPVLIDVEGEHAALWYHLELALPDADVRAAMRQLPQDVSGDPAISLYDYRKRYGTLFLPYLKAALDRTGGLWLAYWGDEAKKHDALDLLAQEGFVRTATLNYQHHGHPIYAYRYDRLALDEGAPGEVARFGEAIALRRVDFPAEAAPGATIPVLLWWQTGAPVPVDYSVSVFLLDQSGALRAQHDSFPAGGRAPTSAWTPGTPVFDAHPLELPADLPPGSYTIGVKLYTYWDQAILPASDGADYAAIGTLTVQ